MDFRDSRCGRYYSHMVTEEKGITSSGATYIRWGDRSCPDVQGTELVYFGTVIGSLNGTNYICLPNNYVSHDSGRPADIPMDRVGIIDHSSVTPCFTTCAVCYTSTRSTILMVPGKLRCPPNWTSEYRGYLMTDANNHSKHECVDEKRDCTQQTGAYQQTEFFTVYHKCVDCSTKPLSCIVCSR